jgi:hypothetical protein
MARMNAESSKFLTKIMTMGMGTSLPITLDPCELAKLIGVIYCDTNQGYLINNRDPYLWQNINPNMDYYDINNSWFDHRFSMFSGQHVEMLEQGEREIDDFRTYLRCLSELHKRRKKYSMILQAQPIPTMIQISPRSLVEYGQTDPQALASWITWRKFFYDLDNRSAQETGYLFEPILASAIGGEQMSARHKAVMRTSDNNKGRQVDCWKVLPDGTKLAYEFKLRVTIAASGQGRFGEEIQFAVDARNSGATPILLVLDPTMNSRLDELQNAYRANGGMALLGDDAWIHLEQQAGHVMSRFIERYVRRPIQHISSFETMHPEFPNHLHHNLLDLCVTQRNGHLNIHIGNITRNIPRSERRSLEDDNDEA